MGRYRPASRSRGHRAHVWGIPHDEARAAYHRLDAHHALMLEPGTDRICIANPLSAVPTGYRVDVAGRSLDANCAWDALGILAMLRADARIEAVFAHTGAPAQLSIEAGRLKRQGGIVHFALPFRRWYDDLVHT